VAEEKGVNVVKTGERKGILYQLQKVNAGNPGVNEKQKLRGGGGLGSKPSKWGRGCGKKRLRTCTAFARKTGQKKKEEHKKKM